MAMEAIDTEPDSDMSEALRRSQAGDHAAFGDIVRHHQSMVFSIALHFVRDEAAAEELAQDAFVDLHRNVGRIESPKHLEFWLRRVTSHRCIDYLRKRRDHASLEEVAEPAGAASVGDPLLDRLLGRLVATLPEAARLVVILRFQEDLNPAEIAEVLDMPLNTVKSHLHRSLALLRDKLGALAQRGSL
jgi:RNA polymerase sigma-70 factor (ECF subfamily)